MSLIFSAIKDNNVNLVREIIRYIPEELQLVNEDNMTPLNLAFAVQNHEIIDLLVDSGIVFNKNIRPYMEATNTYSNTNSNNNVVKSDLDLSA